MPATPDDLFRFLDELGVAHATVNHPPLHTVAQSQALRGGIPGGHSKNLFLKDKKGPLKQGELERAAAWARQVVAAQPIAQQPEPVVA